MKVAYYNKQVLLLLFFFGVGAKLSGTDVSTEPWHRTNKPTRRKMKFKKSINSALQWSQLFIARLACRLKGGKKDIFKNKSVDYVSSRLSCSIITLYFSLSYLALNLPLKLSFT